MVTEWEAGWRPWCCTQRVKWVRRWPLPAGQNSWRTPWDDVHEAMSFLRCKTLSSRQAKHSARAKWWLLSLRSGSSGFKWFLSHCRPRPWTAPPLPEREKSQGCSVIQTQIWGRPVAVRYHSTLCRNLYSCNEVPLEMSTGEKKNPCFLLLKQGRATGLGRVAGGASPGDREDDLGNQVKLLCCFPSLLYWVGSGQCAQQRGFMNKEVRLRTPWLMVQD